MHKKICKSFDGTEIYYIINRINTDPFLIFIHGAGSNHTVYKPFFAAFEHLNFIALDIRNHGKSGKCSLDSITIHNIAKDIAAILAQEGIHDVILMGNSLGASVAVEFYKLYKKNTKKLILFTLFSKRYIKWGGFLNALATVGYAVVKPFHRNQRKKFSDYHKYSEGVKYSNKDKHLHYPAEAIQMFDNKSLPLYPKRPVWYYPYLDIRGTSVATIFKSIKELFAMPLYVSHISVPTQIFICQDDWSTKNSLIKSDCKGNKYIETVDIKSNHVVLTRNHEEALTYVKKFVER